MYTTSRNDLDGSCVCWLRVACKAQLPGNQLVIRPAKKRWIRQWFEYDSAQDYQDMSILLSGSMFAWYPWVLFHCSVFQWALWKIHFWPELISISFTSDHLAACVKSSPTNSERLMPPCKLGFNEAKAAWGHWDYVDLSQFTKVPEGSIKSSALWLMKDCGTKAQNPGLLAGVASFSAGIALHRIRPWKSRSEKLPQNHGTSISTLELCDPEEKQSTSWLSTLLKTAGAGCIIGAASRKVHKYRRAYRAKAEKFPCASKVAKGLLDPLDETTGESELDEVDRKTRRRVRQVVLILSLVHIHNISVRSLSVLISDQFCLAAFHQGR